MGLVFFLHFFTSIGTPRKRLPVETDQTKSCPYYREMMQNRPVGYWRLVEPRGSFTAANSANLEFPGTISSHVVMGEGWALRSCKVTSALFDAPGADISVPFEPTLNPNHYSLELWAQAKEGGAEVTGSQSPLSSTSSEEKQGYAIVVESNAEGERVWRVACGTGSTWVRAEGPVVVPGKWTHVLAAFDGKHLRISVDGQMYGDTTASCKPNQDAPLHIGGGGSKFGPWAGHIAEVVVYSHPLAQTIAGRHFNIGT
eukprot:CAMPEP_0114559986 /NCGR_PEP_ID=MMETSP0114-20121206/11213_1 /TAXON_ID=31324 /ORGANISM="Goniomonas sp, Strain m" /LENGTH=255 /DNA_ID=CAMNT_0001745491 /DNA_START=93 /DNA_END=860 /DNA_ORIENTATION=-